MSKRKYAALLAAATGLSMAGTSQASMQITEWMYNGSEFVEFTNTGTTVVNMNGWSFDDNSNIAGSFDLSAFGMVQPGESVILSEATASDFRTFWGLSASVDVIGGNTQNLGRADTFNLYDNLSQLVDSLVFGDEVFAGTIRTDGSVTRPSSGITTPEYYGANDVTEWFFATVGDSYGSFASVLSTPNSRIGSPGFAVVPEPASLSLISLGAVGLLARRRRA